MKRFTSITPVCLALFFSTATLFAAKEQPIATTAKFEFFNNYWTNLHHFLYEKSQTAHAAVVTDSIENQLIAGLSKEEKKIYDESLEFYKKYLAKRTLVRDEVMEDLRRWLIQFGEKDTPASDSIEASYVQLLKNFNPVYKKHFWKLHSDRNKEVLNKYLPTIKKIESEVFQNIATSAQAEWPEGKMRVDLSVHASRSGGYNFLNPTIILVSTANERVEGTQFIEMLFHEASHTIISEDSGAISSNIARASKILGKEPPYDFWHMVLFYIVGKSTQEALAKQGIEHQPHMEMHGIAKRYYNVLNDNMEIYMDRKISLYEALRRTIDKAYN